MRNNGYKLLIFDWDGTLMDSVDRIANSLMIAIQQAGLPARSLPRLRHTIGLGLNEVIDSLFPEGLDEVKRHAFLTAYRDEFISNNPTPAPLFDGVREMLELFAEQGYRMAIATGKSRAGLDRVLHDTEMQALFPISRCADESGSKPDPAMLYEILRDYDIPASQALMIGDTEYDMEMAQRASVAGVAVTQGVHSELQLRRAMPLVILDQINQLPSWLNNRQSVAV